ncbi:MAG: hypothetical protein K5644_06245 [Lachnospiraceae bacterium]|nr:hypothetical protein [Lachnospiraceae bacterium]
MADQDKKEEKKKKKAEKKEQKKKEKENKKKKGSEGDDDDEEEGSGKGLVVFVAILIFLIWMVILGLLIKMDVGGFGSTVLYPILKNVPVVNKILPEVEEYAKEDAQYSFASVEDAVKRIKELEAELAAAKSSGGVDSARLAELEAQAIELQTYKQNQQKFEEEKEKFYQEVVFSDKAPDINEYKKYYESIQPSNAEAIYKQVVEQTTQDEQIKQYASTYSSMKPAQAAGIFNTMTDNLALVGKILWAMDASSRGKILGAMNADTAAQITKIMEP